MDDNELNDAEIKHINIREFADQGYLQEVNRCFLHPLGLALEIGDDDLSGESYITGVWDYRDDPEGMHFDFNNPDTKWDLEEATQKAETVEAQRKRVLPGRRAKLGFDIEPIPGFNTLWDVNVPVLSDADLFTLLDQGGEEG